MTITVSLAYILILHTHSPDFTLRIWQGLVPLGLFHCPEGSAWPPTAAPVPPRLPSKGTGLRWPRGVWMEEDLLPAQLKAARETDCLGSLALALLRSSR